jgi:ankyrin repeat protein
VEGEKLVPFLVEAGANVNAKDNAGRSPLHLHCARGRVYAIACLLHLGADVDCADTEGATPMNVAAQHGQEEVQRILLGYGASLPYDSRGANIGLSGSGLPPSSSSSASVG